MKQWVTKNGIRIYQVLSGRSNSFLVSDKNRFVLIDTGRKNKRERLKHSLHELKVGSDSLAALVLTHTHFDHAENAFKIKEAYKASLIVHKAEEGFVKSGTNPIIKGSNPITGLATSIFGSHITQLFKYTPASCDIVVHEELSLQDLGFDAYILHTPGHSIGSLSVVIDNEVAIVGDTMFGILKNSVFPPYAENPRLMVSSWGRLLETKSSLFIPGHGSEIHRELLLKEYNKYKTKYNI